MSKTVTWKLVSLLLIACAIVGLTGCGATNPPAGEHGPSTTPEHEVTIGLLLSSLNNPLYVSIQNGAIEAASRLHAGLLVRDAENSSDTQVAQIQELLNLGVDALIINAVDADRVSRALDRARNQDVAVLTIEREVANNLIVSHIASNNVNGGEMAAGFLVEQLGQRGTLTELVGTAGVSVARDRGAGFNRLLARHSDIRVIARRVAHFDRAQAKDAFAQMLEAHDEIDGVFAHNDEMILGAIEAAQEARRADDIVFVGFGAVPSAVDAIEEGQLSATIAQQPAEMGRLSVETAVQYIRGESVPEYVSVDLALITR